MKREFGGKKLIVLGTFLMQFCVMGAAGEADASSEMDIHASSNARIAEMQALGFVNEAGEKEGLRQRVAQGSLKVLGAPGYVLGSHLLEAGARIHGPITDADKALYQAFLGGKNSDFSNHPLGKKVGFLIMRLGEAMRENPQATTAFLAGTALTVGAAGAEIGVVASRSSSGDGESSPPQETSSVAPSSADGDSQEH